MKTKSQIINGTIRFYKTHPRSFVKAHPGNKKCASTLCQYTIKYKNEDGSCGTTHCAVGRYLKSHHKGEDFEENGSSVYDLGANRHGIDYYLVESAQGHEIDFWGAMQGLHDSCQYWRENDKGGQDLTDLGKGAVETICENFDISIKSIKY